MRHFHKAGLSLIAGLVGLGCGHAAMAQGTNQPQGVDQGAPAQGAQQGAQQGAKADQGGQQKGLGAGIGGDQGEKSGAQVMGEKYTEKAGGEKGFVLAPLDAGAGVGHGGYGAGIGGGGEVEPGRPNVVAPAPVPHYWLADASLFVANAENAAQTLANEQTLGVQAPSVLGNQAQFLLAATDRAIASLEALQSNAEKTNPRAVPDIRAAMDQLTAAKGQAQQMLDAANAGTLGPTHQSSIRSAYEHLQAADRNMAGAARAYNAQGFTLASACNFRGRGMGVGIGGKGTAPKAPAKGQPAPEKVNPPAPEKGEQQTPPAEPPGGTP